LLRDHDVNSARFTQTKPTLVFATAHLTAERLFAHQVDALRATHDCRVFASRDHPTLGAMADELLAYAGYLAFEVITRQRERIERLVLLDTRAVADTEAQRRARCWWPRAELNHRHKDFQFDDGLRGDCFSTT